MHVALTLLDTLPSSGVLQGHLSQTAGKLITTHLSRGWPKLTLESPALTQETMIA